MKKSLLLLIALFLSILIYSQTPVPAGPISGTWTLAGSPYQIQGETTILNGTTLTIEPGVLVEWQDNYIMHVQGQILAIGTMTDSIIFIAADSTVGFNGIAFLYTPSGNDTSSFGYCIFKYGRANGNYPLNNGGALKAIDYNKFTVDHCLFTENEAFEVNVENAAGGAIALWTSSPSIRYSKFINNASLAAGAIICYEESLPLIESNEFTGNTSVEKAGIDQGFGGAIMCYINSHPQIRNNTFINNLAYKYGGAISCVSNCNPIIEKNLFYNNTSHEDGGALDLAGYCSPEIINNTIVNNNAYSSGGGLNLEIGCNPQIKNTILWGNTAAMGSQVYIIPSNSVPDFYYCNIQYGLDSIGGAGSTGDYKFCIDADPLFSTLGDFRLSWANFPVEDTTKSPCIDKGFPISPNDPDGTVCDIGAYCFNQMPEIPLAFDPPNHTSTSFEADWSSTYGASGYYLEVAYDNAFNSYVPGYDPMDLNDTISWYDVTGLSLDINYYYRVSALNSACTGDYSNTITVSYVSVNEQVKNPINVYAIDNQIYLENPERITSESYVLVFNCMGQLLAQQSLISGTNQFPAGLKGQIAIVKVVLNDRVYLEKILVK